MCVVSSFTQPSIESNNSKCCPALPEAWVPAGIHPPTPSSPLPPPPPSPHLRVFQPRGLQHFRFCSVAIKHREPLLPALPNPRRVEVERDIVGAQLVPDHGRAQQAAVRTWNAKEGDGGGRGGESERVCGGAHLFVDGNRHWTIVHASLWRWSTVPTPNKDTGAGGEGQGGGEGWAGGDCTQFVRGRSCMNIDPHIPTMPGRSTSGFHQPGRHCLHQARSAVKRSASRMKD